MAVVAVWFGSSTQRSLTLLVDRWGVCFFAASSCAFCLVIASAEFSVRLSNLDQGLSAVFQYSFPGP